MYMYEFTKHNNTLIIKAHPLSIWLCKYTYIHVCIYEHT